MQATRFHVGRVIKEINRNFYIDHLLNSAKLKANDIDQIILAHYIILRAEDIASDEIIPQRKF